MLGKKESPEKYSLNEYINDVIMIALLVLVEMEKSVHEDKVIYSYYRILLSNEK